MAQKTDITNTFTHLTSIDNHQITGDINAHSQQWHSPTEEHRGSLIADIIVNSNQITLNINTPTLIPPHANQQPTSDKHHIPKRRIHHTQITAKTHKKHGEQNPLDPLLAQQNTNIDKEIQNHRQALWKQHLTDNWDHKTNSRTL